MKNRVLAGRGSRQIIKSLASSVGHIFSRAQQMISPMNGHITALIASPQMFFLRARVLTPVLFDWVTFYAKTDPTMH
jgi:hypothetical protein